MNGHEFSHNFHERLDAFRRSDAEREALVQVLQYSFGIPIIGSLHGLYTCLHVTQ